MVIARRFVLTMHRVLTPRPKAQGEGQGRESPLPRPMINIPGDQPSLSLLSPPLPVEVGPFNAVRGLGSAVSSPSGVSGGAPAEIEFSAF